MLFENLESRRLMSVSLDPVSKVLTINGTDNADVISAKVLNGTTLQVKDNAFIGNYQLTKVSKIVINAKNGADTVTLDSTVKLPSTIDAGQSGPQVGIGDKIQGGGGNDTIQLRGYYSTAKGGAGNDTINLFASVSSAFGEAGNDFIANKGANGTIRDNYIDGGVGNDTIDYSLNTAGLLAKDGKVSDYVANSGVPPTASLVTVDSIVNWENFYGGSGNDFIFGNASNNFLKGNAGKDYIRGGQGADVINGGAGEDALYGDDGNDVFQSKDSIKDFLSGGIGTDSANKDAIDVINSVESSF